MLDSLIFSRHCSVSRRAVLLRRWCVAVRVADARDQLIKPIDVRWVDLEDSRLYGVEEIGRRGRESFWSVVVVGQNCPCPDKALGVPAQWIDWFRKTRGIAELNQRAAGFEYRE